MQVDRSLIVGGGYSTEAASSAAHAILAMRVRPTAVFAASDSLAAPLIGLMARRGLRCPQDIAVAGYADTDLAVALGMTSVAQRPEDIGCAALQRLVERVEAPGEPARLVVMPTRLVVRETTISPQPTSP